VQEPKIVQGPIPVEFLLPLIDLKPHDFNNQFLGPASEYENEFVLDKESEAFESILKDLGWDEEDE